MSTSHSVTRPHVYDTSLHILANTNEAEELLQSLVSTKSQELLSLTTMGTQTSASNLQIKSGVQERLKKKEKRKP